MNTHGYSCRDTPQKDTEVIQMLRAELTVVADALDGILTDGFHRRGRSTDDKESHEQWFEDRHGFVIKAREALELSLPA